MRNSYFFLTKGSDYSFTERKGNNAYLRYINGDMMRIFLVRHGESLMNKISDCRFDLPNPIIDLTDKGVSQAEAAGEFLSKFFHENQYKITNTYLLNSPYIRAKRTSDIIAGSLNIKYREENIALAEQQLGLFADYPKEMWKHVFPTEYAQYQHYKKNGCKFWMKYPQGESGFDVANRLHQVVFKVKNDLPAMGIENLVIVSHGLTLRVFAFLWLSKTNEWFDKEPTQGNCWIRMIEDQIDKGYVYAEHDNNKNHNT